MATLQTLRFYFLAISVKKNTSATEIASTPYGSVATRFGVALLRFAEIGSHFVRCRRFAPASTFGGRGAKTFKSKEAKQKLNQWISK